MSFPLISIIVTVYNNEKCLVKCLDSVINQTYTNIEIIIINDGSTDESLKICEEYSQRDQRIILVSQINKGVSEARNAGLEKVNGSYITFVDSDDWVEPDFIETLYNTLKVNDVDLSQCGFFIHKDDCYTVSGSQKKSVLDHNQSLMLLFGDRLVQNFLWNKLFKRSLFDNIRFPVGRYYEDIFVMYQIFDKCSKIAYTEDPKYHYVFHMYSITNDLVDLKSRMKDLFDSKLAQYKFARYSGLWRKGEAKIAKNCISIISRIIRLDPNGREYIQLFIEYLNNEVSYLGLIRYSPYLALRRYIVLNHFNFFVKITQLCHWYKKLNINNALITENILKQSK